MVMKRLVEKGLSVEKVLEWSDSELKEFIYEVNFNGKKVTYIKKCAEIIKN
jgi:endonuclease III